MKHTRNSEVRYMTYAENNLWNTKVNTIGFESISAHSSYPSLGHPQEYSFNFERGRVLQEFQLVYITKGSGQFASQQIQKCDIEEGTIVLLKPEEWHTYRPDETTGWECYWVGFSGLGAENLSTLNQLNKIGYDEEMVGLYRKILDVSNDERPGYQQLISGILIHLVAHLIYRAKDKNWRDKQVIDKIDKARILIREKINTQLSPEEIAASLNMSYTWFRRMFRQYTGLAPAQYIAQLKIQKAKEVLSVSNKTIKEIAIDLGFESIDYFSTQFRKQTGQTPTQFRLICQGSRAN
jgi:AraC-like DNA-binding protein